MHFLAKLKKILQSKVTYLVLLIFLVLYVLIITVIIKYDTKINGSIVEGVVVSLSVREDNISFIIKGKEKVKCTFYIDDTSKYKNLLGKKVEVNGEIKELYNNTIPNNFNYKKYLYNNRIYAAFKVDNIEILEAENVFYKIKNTIISKIDNYEDTVKTYLNLFVLGNKDLLNDNVYEIYRTNGIWHLFAISGMHINLIILALNKILQKVKFQKLIISSVLFYFMFLTTFSASVQRTTIFYFLKSILEFFDIKIESKKILFLTAFIILLINPFMIYNSGFQYSFLITLAIMLESKYITGSYLKKIFKTSLLSFIVSLPITVNINYEINIISILLNVFYVPFISFVVFPLSILSFVFPFLSIFLSTIIYFLELSNRLFFNLKFCLFMPKISVVLISFYYLLLFLYHRFRHRIYLLMILSVLLINIIIPKLNSNYNIYYFDVGQGDSSLIISPYKQEIVLIDTGGIINSNFHISNNIILFLKSIGITKISSMIITHGDYDHMGEAINLVNNIKIEKEIFNCGPYNDLEKELIKVLDKKHIKYYSCIKELNIDKNKLYFLQTKEYDTENDNSNVIYTELNGYKFMFMGDAYTTTEKEILSKYNLSDVDVLKVGHHGSKTSSSREFINEVNPNYSIISVGKNNRYGHPNKEVLDNLKNSKIYRTDQDGSIMFKIKNKKLKIETCSP